MTTGVMESLSQRAAALGVPLSVHVDLTWKCNERCVHCYLDHDDPAQLSLNELRTLLDQMAEAGVFFLTFSGGEIFLRRDLRDIVDHATSRGFGVTLKTNGVLIDEAAARWIRELGVAKVQISLYSHNAAIHDAVTKAPGSFEATVRAIRLLRARDVRVLINCPLLSTNYSDLPELRNFARELGAEISFDPTITPHINGSRDILRWNMTRDQLRDVLHDTALSDPADAVFAPPDDAALDQTACSAGHTSCYVSPQGDVFPCVQFPVRCGNVREQDFLDIWRGSAELSKVRSIRARDLPTCSSCGHLSSCSRCPGLAWMEGSMYGPSLADCEKSFLKTGQPTANMQRHGWSAPPRAEAFVQIQPAQ